MSFMLFANNLKGILLISTIQGRRDRGVRGDHGSQFFRSRQIFRNFNGSSENFRTFAIRKDKGFEFYRKIIELGPPILQVPQRPCYYWYLSAVSRFNCNCFISSCLFWYFSRTRSSCSAWLSTYRNRNNQQSDILHRRFLLTFNYFLMMGANQRSDYNLQLRKTVTTKYDTKNVM